MSFIYKWLSPRQKITYKRIFHHLNRKLLIFKSNLVSFLPNRPKETKWRLHPNISKLLAHKGTMPTKKGISKKKKIIIVFFNLFQNYPQKFLWQVHLPLFFFFLYYINSLTPSIQAMFPLFSFFFFFTFPLTPISIVPYHISYCYFSLFPLTFLLIYSCILS